MITKPKKNNAEHLRLQSLENSDKMKFLTEAMADVSNQVGLMAEKVWDVRRKSQKTEKGQDLDYARRNQDGSFKGDPFGYEGTEWKGKGIKKGLNLTRLEWLILEDRLEVEDAVVEALSDNPDEGDMRESYAAEDLEDCFQVLREKGFDEAVKFKREMFCAILKECWEGGTYLERAEGLANLTDGQCRKLEKAYEGLGEKIQLFKDQEGCEEN